MASVQLKNISKTYKNGVTAVNDINLDIKDKEFIVFVGPSGCGKSTTLRMIAGLEKITDGELYIDDKKVNNVGAKDRDIAMVFQSYALYPHMTVEQNMGFALKMRNVDKNIIKEKVLETAKILHLEDLLDKKPSELSGGQRQRVALGRAMVRKPKVFLFDEPLSKLDAKLRVQMRNEIVKLHQNLDTTFIYVTHDQVEAITMGDRIAVLNQGNIEQFDTPLNLYYKPRTKFIAEFIGSPKMNIMKTLIFQRDDKYYAKLFGNDVEIPKYKIDEIKMTEYAEEYYIGIRCEDFYVDNSSPIKVRGEIVENMGSDIYLYTSAEESESMIVMRF